MPNEDQIEAKGEIIEVLAHGGFRARLANGHVCVARVPAKAATAIAVRVGDWVRLAFHPADLSRARILGWD